MYIISVLTSLPNLTNKFKAVLLAGGYGTRAKPFTDYFPKAMFPLEGRPVIDHIVRFLSRVSSISEIIIVCDFDRFGKQIINYFEGKDSVYLHSQTSLFEDVYIFLTNTGSVKEIQVSHMHYV